MVKKHRTDSESFDVRSQYTPFFPPQQPPGWQPVSQYAPMGIPQYGSALQNPYTGPSAPQYGASPQQFHPTMVPGGAPPSYHQMPQVLFFKEIDIDSC
jgi:hypothetical protein